MTQSPIFLTPVFKEKSGAAPLYEIDLDTAFLQKERGMLGYFRSSKRAEHRSEWPV